jgi:hypothetical protein
VPDFEDVRRLAAALPEVDESTTHGNLAWKVRGKLFAWERPLRASDRAALGADAPDGPILGLRTDGQAGKEAVLATGAPACFTTPHFDGYPAVLVQLDVVAADELAELVVEAWLAQAPKGLAKEFLAGD